jgi:hypothetical protein
VALINNAGIAIPGPLEVISDELIKQQFDVNVFGVIRGRYSCSLFDQFQKDDLFLTITHVEIADVSDIRSTSSKVCCP